MDAGVGTLRVCATPLGNLEDITLRVLAALRESNLIAAEDTRHTQKLLARYDIHTPLVSYHQHNESSRVDGLIARLRAGESIALVSDAGTPGISDPGEVLIKAAIEAGIPLEVCPGPSAAITALVASGLSTDRWVFEGFLPRKGKERQSRLVELSRETRTIIIYEAPHRLKATLKDLGAQLGGERRCSLARELTKRYEEVRRGSLAEHLQHFQEVEPRGEFCLVLEGLTAQPDSGAVDQPGGGEQDPAAIRDRVRALQAGGATLKEAARVVAGEVGLSRNAVYSLAIAEQRPSDAESS